MSRQRYGLCCALLVGISVFTRPGWLQQGQAQAAAEDNSVREYAIADLTEGGSPAAWVHLVTTVVQPQSWHRTNGGGAILTIPPDAPRALAIEQSLHAHREIAGLFSRVRRATRAGNQVQAVHGQLGVSRAEQRLLDALKTRAVFEFTDTSLAEAIKDIRDLQGIELRMTWPALERAGISPETPITASLSDIPLETALQALLGELGLAYFLEDDAVVITTAAAARDRRCARLYAVAGLPGCHDGPRGLDCRELMRTIQAAIAPESWRNGRHGAMGVIARGPARSLVVVQTDEIQRRVAQLLDHLRAVAAGNLPINNGEKEVLGALDSKSEMEFADMPLPDVLDYLRQYHGIPIQLSPRALPRGRPGIEPPAITAHLRGVKLREALQMILRDLNLTYVVEGGVLRIVSWDEAQSKPLTKVYAVADLLGPAAAAPDADELARLLTAGVAGGSWRSAGGPGVVVPHPPGMVRYLVVTQSYPAHEQIGQWFDTLRLVCGRSQALCSTEAE